MEAVKKKKEIEIKSYMIMLSIFSFSVFLCNYQGVVRSYNTTMLALSYQYGFTSRSLLGALYHLLDYISPIDMMHYPMVMRTAQVITGIFFFLLLWFSYQCLKHCDEKSLKPCEYLILFFMFFTVSTFSGGYNFFRVDLFLISVSIISALLLVYGKAEWLVVPLSAIGVMFHQGYVFMYFNIPLVLLACKFLEARKGNKLKYAFLFVISFVVGSVLFLWFEFFSRSNGELYFDQIVDEARNISLNGYHTTLLYHEVLGIDLGTSEDALQKINYTQLPIFTILCFPYIVVTIKFFMRLFRRAERALQRWKYTIILLGAGTMLPDFILKIDYGRWILAVMVYYIVVILALCMMKDKIICEELYNVYLGIRQKPWSFLLILLPVFLGPFWDIDINSLLQHVGWWFNDHLLHWYHF